MARDENSHLSGCMTTVTGHCTCKGKDSGCRLTLSLFPELVCPKCGGVDHRENDCPELVQPGQQLKLL